LLRAVTEAATTDERFDEDWKRLLGHDLASAGETNDPELLRIRDQAASRSRGPSAAGAFPPSSIGRCR
jgi:hypothetical protein